MALARPSLAGAGGFHDGLRATRRRDEVREALIGDLEAARYSGAFAWPAVFVASHQSVAIEDVGNQIVRLRDGSWLDYLQERFFNGVAAAQSAEGEAARRAMVEQAQQQE